MKFKVKLTVKRTHHMIGFLYLLISCFLITTYNNAIASDFSELQQSIRSSDELKRLLLNHGYKEILLRLSKDNFLMLDISIGDEQSVQPFILDTGATQNSIDQKLEEKYKFKGKGKSFVTGGASGNSFRTYQVIIPKMHLGSFNTDNQLASIQHFSHIRVDQRPIAGMMGLDFLRQYHAILDISHQRLFLKLQSDKSIISQETLKNKFAKMGYASIQLKRSPSGHQTVLVKINNANPVRFMLDTGIAPFMIASYYEKNIAIKNKKNYTTGKGSSGGVMKMFDAAVEGVTIGSITGGPQKVIVTTGVEDAKIGTPIFGFVGLNWMLSHQAILDVTNDLLFVKPDAPAAGLTEWL